MDSITKYFDCRWEVKVFIAGLARARSSMAPLGLVCRGSAGFLFGILSFQARLRSALSGLAWLAIAGQRRGFEIIKFWHGCVGRRKQRQCIVWHSSAW